MASAVYARQLAAEDSKRHWEGIQGAGRPYDAIMDRDSSCVASSSKAPLPVSLLIRPGMGRQLSSVSNLIDAYRNSPTAHNSASSSTNDGNTHSRGSSMNFTSISAPNSPSTPASSSSKYDRSQSPSHVPRSLYYSQIITRRSSMQVSGSPRASTSGSSDLSLLVRERRPSAPEIHSPPTRLTSGSAGDHGWNATLAPSGSSSNNNNMASVIDIKRLRSKPAPPQSHASTTASQNWMPPSSTLRDQDCMPTEEGQSLSSITALPTAVMPKRDLDTAIEPLTTMLHNTQMSSSSQASTSSASSAMRMNASSDQRAGPAYSTSASSAESRGAEQRQGQHHNQHPQEQASSSHNLHTLYDSPSSTLGNHRHTPHLREDISNTSNTHVDDSLYHYYPASSGRSRFDSSTSNTDTTSSHYTTTGPLPRPPSPQTPRKIRNSSLPMGTSPSLSSSPNPGTGKQSPSSSVSQRRPLKPIVPTSHTVLLPGQPALPPASPRFRSKSANNDYNVGEMYESILPTSSSLRPNRQPSSDNMFITSPPSTSAAMITSPEDELPVDVASPPIVRKERGILSPGSPTPHKKLVRKSSRGHLRRDSGTSGHGQASTTTSIVAHSRSLSLPRTSSRGSTPTAGTGSGSGSEQDDTTTILSSSNSHSHFFTQRPAWLDQDPAASNSIPPLPNTSNLTSRIKSPPQHPLLSQSNNRSMTSLHQQYNVDGAGLESSFFGPSSLPSTSTLAAQHAHREEPQAAPPKRKASFYRRKRSQTASGSENVDSNGFPIPSPMSEIVKSMPLHGRMSHDVLQPPPALPPKRNASASSGGGGGFLSSITRKLSHPNIKDPSPTFAPVNVDPSTDYFAGACPPPPEKSHTHPIPQQHHHSSPKLGSSFSSRSWLHPFGGDHSKHHNDPKALPQLPQAGSNGPTASSSGKGIYGDPFSASSTMSLPGFLHRSPRKDSLSSDKSEQSSGHRRKDARSRTISQDGDSSDGHSSEVGYTSLRSYDLAPPVPELPFGMRNTAGSPSAASTLPKASKKSHGLLRSPPLGQRGKKAAPDLDLSPTTPRAAVFNSNDNGINDEALPSPTRAGMLVISKANESLDSARRKGLGDSMRASSESNRNDGRSDVQHDQAPSKLGSFAAMDKIAAIENDMKEAKFMALWDRSERAEKGVIKLSLASSAAREAGIA